MEDDNVGYRRETFRNRDFWNEKNTKGYTKNKRRSRDAIGICAPSFLVRSTVHVWFYFDFPYFSSQYMQR